VEGAGRFGHFTRTKFANVSKPRNSAPQALQGRIGSAAELASEFRRQAYLQQADAQERRML
jgi:hypothetical protein